MDAELIFLDTLSDIRNKIQDSFLDPVHYELFDEAKRYDLIKACGLLRQLFLDDDNLVNAVNKKYKVPIVFRIRDFVRPMPKNSNAIWFSILPAPYDSENIKVKLKEFLQLTPLIYLNHVYSIKNIIKISSHVLGGIHLRPPKDEKEKAFALFENYFYIYFIITQRLCLFKAAFLCGLSFCNISWEF